MIDKRKKTKYKITIEGEDLSEPILLEAEYLKFKFEFGILEEIDDRVLTHYHYNGQQMITINAWNGIKNMKDFKSHATIYTSSIEDAENE